MPDHPRMRVLAGHVLHEPTRAQNGPLVEHLRDRLVHHSWPRAPCGCRGVAEQHNPSYTGVTGEFQENGSMTALGSGSPIGGTRYIRSTPANAPGWVVGSCQSNPRRHRPCRPFPGPVRRHHRDAPCCQLRGQPTAGGAARPGNQHEPLPRHAAHDCVHSPLPVLRETSGFQ